MQNSELNRVKVYLFSNTISNNIYSEAFEVLLTSFKLRGQYLGNEYYPKK